jgi:hypothetical protein
MIKQHHVPMRRTSALQATARQRFGFKLNVSDARCLSASVRCEHMSLLHNLKLRFSPPRIADPDFGSLLFMYVPNAPERSYWEGEWVFPKTATPVAIGLDGDESGPLPAARQFYLGLPSRFEQILAAARPKLQEVFRKWLEQDLPQDIFTAVKLAGFGVEDAKATPLHWDISFETTGDKWLGIVIPFEGDTPQEPVVDT